MFYVCFSSVASGSVCSQDIPQAVVTVRHSDIRLYRATSRGTRGGYYTSEQITRILTHGAHVKRQRISQNGEKTLVIIIYISDSCDQPLKKKNENL